MQRTLTPKATLSKRSHVKWLPTAALELNSEEDRASPGPGMLWTAQKPCLIKWLGLSGTKTTDNCIFSISSCSWFFLSPLPSPSVTQPVKVTFLSLGPALSKELLFTYIWRGSECECRCCWTPEEGVRSPGAGVTVPVNCLTQGLGTELRFSARKVRGLNH